MKRLLPIFLSLLILCGCGAPAAEPLPTDSAPESYPTDANEKPNLAYSSRFEYEETVIRLSDDGIDVTGSNSLTVFTSHDIIYYEDKDAYESGNPYGEGEDAEKHTAEEAEKHTVVNITEPGAYRITGTLSHGQIRVDLGEDAYENATAIVELILEDADITCTVAPAILFLNVYECDGNWSTGTAKPEVDTSYAGANLILEGENTVTGSHVAKIFKDKQGEKKLWKQDGAIYSYMSMNVYGPGSLTLNADNEGLDTELHLTLNGGDITILSGNDGINTNEDGVSVTTINGGTLHIVAGLGEEGDGIDSNGYLVINGGTVISAAKPAGDSGLDSDLGSFIHGGTVVALGAAMDWAESDSDQVTMNLQFAQHRNGAISVNEENGSPVFTFDPTADPILIQYNRGYQGVVISCPSFKIGDSYAVTVDGTKMMYTSTDVIGHGPGGFGGGFGGQRPDGHEPPEGERPTMPEGEIPGGDREPPEGFGGEMPTMPEGEVPTFPEGEIPSMPAGEPPARPEGDSDDRGGFGGFGHGGPNADVPTGEGNTVFFMQDKVNFFSGLTAAE